MTTVRCNLILDKEQFDKYTDFLSWLKKDKEAKNVDKGLGKCAVKGCGNFASQDYNNHKYYVCDHHYETLNDEFDNEYR